MFIDTHCHLGKEDYEDLEQVIKNMGNNIMIVSGASLTDNYEVLELVHKYPNIYGTIGIHPGEIAEYTTNHKKWLEKNISNPKIVGIGEIGLDYHYPNIDKEKQKEVFIDQIKLAQKYNKSIVIHSRDAMEDTINILKEYLNGTKATMHCYSGSIESAKELQKLGVKFGIGGVITFMNAKRLVEVIKKISLSDLLLETDSPYLSPVPLRGQRNEPRNVEIVAEKIAEIKGISKEEVINTTTDNAIEQFDLKL